MVLRGSNRPGHGSGMVYASRVIHLGSKRGSGMLGAACTVAGAALRGGTCRRARVQVALVSGPGAGGCACVREAKAHLGGARAALQGARHGEAVARAVAEHRSRGVPATRAAFGS
jgi:hypothetical protein